MSFKVKIMTEALPVIIQVAVERIVDLRHAVLRAGLPRESALFPGDRLETSRHWAALLGDEVVGCVTLHRQSYGGEEAWQLRGMAVKPGLQRGGVGGLLLQASEAFVAETTPGRLLWCNAREPAVGFYERFGWKIDSDRFIIPDAGPHFRMVRQSHQGGRPRGDAFLQ